MVEYHRLIGAIDHFYLYLMSSYTDEEASDLPALDYVTYVPFLMMEPTDVVDTGVGSRVFGFQVVQIHDLLYRARAAGFDWFFFNDIDEYLQMMGGGGDNRTNTSSTTTQSSSNAGDKASSQLDNYLSQDVAFYEVSTWFFGNPPCDDQPGYIRRCFERQIRS